MSDPIDALLGDEPDLLSAIDELINPATELGRADVIRMIIREWLTDAGRLPEPSSDGIRPRQSYNEGVTLGRLTAEGG